MFLMLGPEVQDVTQEVVAAAETGIREGLIVALLLLRNFCLVTLDNMAEVAVEAHEVAVCPQGNVESLNVTGMTC